MKKILLVLTFFGLLVALACSSGNDDESDSNNFDRTALLTNWADNIIIPSYLNYQSKLQALRSNATAFTTTPNETNLQALRNSWLETYKAYQYVALYNMGKAEEINFNMTSNTYPTNKVGIEANVASGTYDLTLLSQFDKQGLPALDYLLNGLGADDATILSFYSNRPNAINYKKYLTDLVTQLKTSTDLIVTDWNSGYRDSYIANNETSVDGSISITTNLFVKNLEKDVRTGKVGIPSGVFSGGTIFPEKVEGYYKKDISKELLLTAIKASQDFFNGKHFIGTTTGESLKSYLDYVNAISDGKKLSDVINTQYTTILQLCGTLNDNLSKQLTTNNTLMITAYDALQQNVIYTKLDMIQKLNFKLDYQDNDGD